MESPRWCATYGFEDVLVNPLITQWLQMIPIERGLARAWATAENHQFHRMLATERWWDCGYNVQSISKALSCKGIARIGHPIYIPGSLGSMFTYEVGSKAIVAVGACPRKNSSGVLNFKPALIAKPLAIYGQNASYLNMHANSYRSAAEWSPGRPAASPTKNDRSVSTPMTSRS